MKQEDQPHTPKGTMIGHGVKERASGTSRSGKVNDRLRRSEKRGERNTLRLDLKNGHYARLLP